MLFTSGATESDNLAILGLREHGENTGRRHMVSTAIEHKAVLEPLEHLARHGFEVTLVRPEATGAVLASKVAAAVRPDTLLVSVMHANNETGAMNIAIPGLDSEAVMLALKDVVAISNGSACTSQNYTASHVLTAMGLQEEQIKGALRLSWCHLTPDPPWPAVIEALERLK